MLKFGFFCFCLNYHIKFLCFPCKDNGYDSFQLPQTYVWVNLLPIFSFSKNWPYNLFCAHARVKFPIYVPNYMLIMYHNDQLVS